MRRFGGGVQGRRGWLWIECYQEFGGSSVVGDLGSSLECEEV